MLRPIVAGMLVTVERRGLVELFPEATRKWCKKFALRFAVVFSLVLQIALIVLGKLRKRKGKPFLRFIVWTAYILADSVAIYALGAISNYVNDLPTENAPFGDDLVSFWAPFLLLHLGGPDTITAYSLEDNQLWHRRVLELLTQFLVCLYILVIAWPGVSFLSLLSIPMLIIGLIKLIERICSLRSASTDQFRLLMMEPDPGPNYSKFMEDFTLKKAEGFYVKALEVIETPLPTCAPTSVNNEELVLKAYDLFQTFKRLFVDLILSFHDRNESQSFFHNLKCEEAFEVIEIELGFAYDVFYTKAPVVYNLTGQFFRLITLVTTLSSLVVFSIMHRDQKEHFHTVDLYITYILLVAAIMLEICSYFILLVSDWSDYSHKKRIISCFRQILWIPPRKRWSNVIAQHSIQNFCREENSAIIPRIMKVFLADNKVNELFHLTYLEVSSNLKSLIFKQFLEISKCGDKSKFTALCTSRGMRVLEKFDCSNLNWSVTEVEFDQSILLWHIATDLCYYSEHGSEGSETATNSESTISSECRESKHMSEYMMYLLVMCPFMLPMEIGMIRLQDTCAEAWEFFKERIEKLSKYEACMMLLRVNTEIKPGKVKGDRSKSVLFDACRLATELRSKGGEDKWQIISQVWVEILAYAACHCHGYQHAHQLRKGGEFLTHVWLLMAHLGITEQFQISQGHARAKMCAK